MAILDDIQSKSLQSEKGSTEITAEYATYLP